MSRDLIEKVHKDFIHTASSSACLAFSTSSTKLLEQDLVHTSKPSVESVDHIFELLVRFMARISELLVKFKACIFKQFA